MRTIRPPRYRYRYCPDCSPELRIDSMCSPIYCVKHFKERQGYLFAEQEAEEKLSPATKGILEKLKNVGITPEQVYEALVETEFAKKKMA